MVTAGIAQLVEHHVANVNVASSSLVSRSRYIPLSRGNPRIKSGAGPCGCLLIPSSASGFSFYKGITLAGWQSGYAAACKAVDAGSIPTPASIFYFPARVVELVDTRDLKSLGGNSVPVRVRPRAPIELSDNIMLAVTQRGRYRQTDAASVLEYPGNHLYPASACHLKR